jgi:hypothetical protein
VDNPQSTAVLSTDVASGGHNERVVTIGQKFIWWSQPVELIDVASLDPDWCQVLVRFVDDMNRPPVSMPYEELVEGLAS